MKLYIKKILFYKFQRKQAPKSGIIKTLIPTNPLKSPLSLFFFLLIYINRDKYRFINIYPINHLYYPRNKMTAKT